MIIKKGERGKSRRDTIKKQKFQKREKSNKGR